MSSARFLTHLYQKASKSSLMYGWPWETLFWGERRSSIW